MKVNARAVVAAEGHSSSDEFFADVREGLLAEQKFLNPKYFYDESGSRLFEKITRLPEYYITRTETTLMSEIAEDIASHCKDVRAIVEFGSGSGRRSDILLSALPDVTCYVPIDVSEELLASTSQLVREAHPGVRVTPLNADFTQPLTLPADTPVERLGYFPGSTIGNFLPDDAIRFMRMVRTGLGGDAQMLLGVDTVKELKTLEQAYDDDARVTANFNKNILTRINDELGGDFDLNQFAHRAFFNADESRVEMHLVSRKRQRVRIGEELAVDFVAGESIHTENSHKYTMTAFHALAENAGWHPVQHWNDEEMLFSVHLLKNSSIIGSGGVA